MESIPIAKKVSVVMHTIYFFLSRGVHKYEYFLKYYILLLFRISEKRKIQTIFFWISSEILRVNIAFFFLIEKIVQACQQTWITDDKNTWFLWHVAFCMFLAVSHPCLKFSTELTAITALRNASLVPFSHGSVSRCSLQDKMLVPSVPPRIQLQNISLFRYVHFL